MNDNERQAADFLACSLFGANTIEFCNSVGKILREYEEGRETATEAVWQISRVYRDLNEANRKLMFCSMMSQQDKKLLPGS